MNRRALLAVGCALMGFLVVVALRAGPVDPESRLPERFRLVGLIHREQQTAVRLRRQVDALRADVDRTRRAVAGRHTSTADVDKQLATARTVSGLAAMAGPGLKIVLDDSSLRQSPSGNVNDLVIHSQDVQAVVNAAWRAGAEAVSINDQRLIGTSAVLCVGNTLLLNGTVHSPPYVVVAVGAVRSRFEGDELVRRLHQDADSFGLRFSVSRSDDLHVPAFDGPTTLRYAKPAP